VSILPNKKLKLWNLKVFQKPEWYFHAVFTAKARPFLEKGMGVSFNLIFFFKKFVNPRILNYFKKASRFIGRETMTSL